MALLGIDLGTTYSVVATPQKLEGKYFQNVRGVTVIKDSSNQRLTPSVVALSPQGELVVGRRAKSLAGRSPAPILFVKRHMGEDTELELGDRRLLPEMVSAEILRFLKEMVEKQLGEEVEEVVVSVPAYFDTGQKQKTREAAELAGLTVGEIVQEPVAAALSYCAEDERDPLTLMTYDLGGGTFDVSLLRRKEGTFEILEFDGDPRLGGCDFDKRLARWIVDRLSAGYALDLDPQSPEWSQVLLWAETAKLKLTDHELFEIRELNTGIVDARGEPVSVDGLEISRETFENLISEDVERTIQLCRRALEKAELRPEDLDEIVMVGGSSRIPLVSRRLEEEFGRRPRLADPDLAVAVGAAIVARSLGRRVGPLKLDPIPESTGLAALQLTGKVEPSPRRPAVAGCRLTLVPADGSSTQSRTVGDDGGFLFQVPLVVGADHELSLRVETHDGTELFTHRFTVRRHAVDAVPEQGVPDVLPPTNVLAKPISIMTVTGLKAVAEAKTALPYEAQVPARTTDQTGEVHVPIYEADREIGEIVVEAVPRDLPVGSRVEIWLTLRSDFFIDGRATIPAAGIESRTSIRIPPIRVKSLGELQEEFLVLDRRSSEALAQADRGQAFKIAPPLKAALKRARQLLYEERDPEPAKAQELLAEIEGHLRQLSTWRPDPPVEQFEATRRELAEELLPQLGTGNRGKVEHEARFKAIVEMAEEALEAKNEAGWGDANRRLDDLRERILSTLEERHRRASGDGGAKQPPEPRALKLKLGMHLTRLREESRRKGLFDELAGAFDLCAKNLQEIDASSANAMVPLAEYYENHHQPLEAKVSGSRTSRSKKLGWVQALVK